MVSIVEYRIVMPLSVEEYKIGQLYAVAKQSLNETGGSEGIEVLENHPFEKQDLFNGRYASGQYTKKVYRLHSKVSWWARRLVPKKSLVVVEEAWNAYPYCKTMAKSTNDDYTIEIQSVHLADCGTTENALELDKERLAQRKVVFVDIAGKLASKKDYKRDTDPSHFASTKTGRGKLHGEWWKTHTPVMCCYKVVMIEVKGWSLLRGKILSYLNHEYARLFQKFNRVLFCTIDGWFGMTIEDIRVLEEETIRELKQKIATKGVCGHAPDEES